MLPARGSLNPQDLEDSRVLGACWVLNVHAVVNCDMETRTLCRGFCGRESSCRCEPKSVTVIVRF